jgi:hypothetical protein
VGLENAIILTSKDGLGNRDYARVSYLADRNNTGMPCDPGFTAGGYFATPEDVSNFSQEYISGRLFTRPEYKEYIANSFAASSKTALIHGKRYQNSLSFEELDVGHPLYKKGFTHLIGHRGDTPNIMTFSKTPVKIEENGKINEVGHTSVFMSVLDSTTYEKKLEMRQKQVGKQVNQNEIAHNLKNDALKNDLSERVNMKSVTNSLKISSYLDVAYSRPPLKKGKGLSR